MLDYILDSDKLKVWVTKFNLLTDKVNELDTSVQTLNTNYSALNQNVINLTSDLNTLSTSIPITYVKKGGDTLTGILIGVTPEANATKELVTAEWVNTNSPKTPISSDLNSESETTAASSKAVKILNDSISNQTYLPVGYMFDWPYSTPPENCIVADGSEYDRNLYASLWEYIKDKTFCKTEEEWTQIAQASNGYCPYYSVGNGTSTFRTPKFAPFKENTNTKSDAGSYTEAGLPNITGETILSNSKVAVSPRNATGAFFATNNAMRGYNTASALEQQSNLAIDASRSSNKYGKSDTVQPESNKWITCIVAVGFVTNKSNIDISGLVDRIQNLNTLPIGTIIWSCSPTAPAGFLIANGSNASRDTYKELFAVIGTTYGEGDGVTTFGLPNMIGRVAWGGTTPGAYLAAGLPDATGTFRRIVMFDKTYTANGVFSQSRFTPEAESNLGSSGEYVGQLQFALSQANAIYGTSDTVQPPALTLVPYIKAFGAVVDDRTINITSLANDVAKLDAERKKSIGKIEIFATATLPEGWMICDGSSIVFSDWPEFKQAYDEGKFNGKVVDTYSEAERGKFVKNGDIGLYAPSLEGLFVQASSLANSGKFVEAGLPNITGYDPIRWGLEHDGIVNNNGGQTGAFAADRPAVQGILGGSPGDASASTPRGIAINASLSSPVYGKSDTVQPPAAQYVIAVYLGRPNATTE